MNAMQNLVTGPAAHVLGWALLHFLWQGVLIAMLLKLILRVIPARLAGLRYWIASAALTAMLWMPGISIWRAFPARPAVMIVPAEDAPAIASAATTAEVVHDRAVPVRADALAVWQRLARERLGSMAPWLSLAWFGGAILYALVMLGGLFRAQFLRRSATSMAGDEWTGKLRSLTLDSRSQKPVRLLESNRVSVPTVIGWLRPSILLPAGVADELAAEFMDALLAHELAHIRRRDYLVNLFQTMIEVLLWYHPATWWVALQVRAERECCCDDEAVAVCGNPLTYARALSSAERLRSASKWAIALSGASLLHRIRRLTEMKTPNLSRFAVCLIGFLAIGLILAAGAGSSVLAYVPAIAERPVAVAMPLPSEQIVRPEVLGPVRAVPKSQAAVEIKTVQKAPAPEKFVRPTQVPSMMKWVPPTEIPREYGPAQWAAQQEKYEALLAAERQKLAELKVRLDKDHPEVVQLSRLIADLETQKEDLMRRHAQLLASLGPKITGSVYDPAGAVVPGVGISLVNTSDKRMIVMTTSDARGHFEIDSFTGFDFELRFELAGFAPQVLSSRNMGTAPLGVMLELGSIKETVTIMTGAVTGVAVPATIRPIRVGGSIVQPKLIQRVEPVYPPQAKIDNIEGTVVISALIDEEGQVKNAVMLSGHTMLKDAALESVRQWRFSPALLNGEPWSMRLSITLVFMLAR